MRLIDADHLKKWIINRGLQYPLKTIDILDQIDRELTYAEMKPEPSAELELEELKAEADKLGYKLVKKPEKIKLLPCSCGCKKKPTEWIKASSENGGWFYECDYCDKKSEVVNTKIGAKRAWNRMILEQGE